MPMHRCPVSNGEEVTCRRGARASARSWKAEWSGVCSRAALCAEPVCELAPSARRVSSSVTKRAALSTQMRDSVCKQPIVSHSTAVHVL
jgi:hypothetical protein